MMEVEAVEGRGEGLGAWVWGAAGWILTGAGLMDDLGIKEYSEWPTIPQLYVDKEFVGGCDIIVAMHQNGELAKMLEEKKVLVPAEGEAPKE
jgi:hypothetical protein